LITLACLDCRLALRTVGDHGEIDGLLIHTEWYPDRYPCPRSGCSGLMTLTDAIASSELDRLEMHDLSPQEVFQALQGMGLPSEKDCSVAHVQEALLQKRVLSLDIRSVSGTARSVVYSILLEDGVRVYFGSGPQGATVYRIAPKRSLTQEVLGEQSG
jgi:hypothetical protein